MGGRGRQAGDIATRSHQTRDQSGADRVRRYREHDRNDGCRLLHRDYDIDLEPDELSRDLCEPAGASVGPAILDREVAALYPTEFAQPLHKSGSPWSPGRSRGRAKKPDGRHLPRLLRPRRERPYRCAAEQRDELAAPHSITSSARASSDAGTESPSAFAVFKLTTNSYLFGV